MRTGAALAMPDHLEARAAAMDLHGAKVARLTACGDEMAGGGRDGEGRRGEGGETRSGAESQLKRSPFNSS